MSSQWLWYFFLCSLFGFAQAQDPYTNTTDANFHRIPSYSPARPPAVPLAVKAPYTSAWQSTADNGTLNSASAQFWTGTPVGWEGIVRVDGISYEYLGVGSQSLPQIANLKTAIPLSVSYDSQYSNYTFAAGPVEIVASFFSPVIPTDLCRTSIPLSYLTTTVNMVDYVEHSVQFYSDINAAWITYESNKTVIWDLYRGSYAVNGSGNATDSPSLIYSWLFNLSMQYEFGEIMDFPQWGNFSYTTSPGQAQNFSFQSGFSANSRYSFAMGYGLNDNVDSNFRGSAEQEPAFAFAHDFGYVDSASVMYTIGSIQDPIMRFLTSDGLTQLHPYWTGCYGDQFQMIEFHYGDFAKAAALGSGFEAQLKSDIDSFYTADQANVYSNSTPSPPPTYPNQSISVDQFGQQYYFDPSSGYGFLNPTTFAGIAVPDVSEAESYYSIVALAARQIMAAYVLTITPTLSCGNQSSLSEPLMFQKEISSDGNVNTVDVMYPAMPFFLYANPQLLKYNLNPLYYNQEHGFYPNGYSMHDLGTNFPNATGHVEGNDEFMPVEESGNMVLMTYAYYHFTGDLDYLRSHYYKLTQWAQFLVEYSLVPGMQLSTDDFAGQLTNQTNLAIKGIVALSAVAAAADAVGAAADAANYSATATQYFTQWEYYAIDPSHNHTMLAYEWRSSWGLLYNIFPAQLLNLPIIPTSLFQMQCNWYPQVSQVFGVPLDNRHSLTKSDWELWTAATCPAATRRLFVDSVAYWLNYTSTPYAFSDLYETISEGGYPTSDTSEMEIQFIARPVQGGLFSLLALGKARSNASIGAGQGAGGGGSNNGTVMLW